MKLTLISDFEGPILEYYKKIGPKKWRVYSKKGKNLGTGPSKAWAKKRLGQVEYFKHKNK